MRTNSHGIPYFTGRVVVSDVLLFDGVSSANSDIISAIDLDGLGLGLSPASIEGIAVTLTFFTGLDIVLSTGVSVA